MSSKFKLEVVGKQIACGTASLKASPKHIKFNKQLLAIVFEICWLED